MDYTRNYTGKFCAISCATSKNMQLPLCGQYFNKTNVCD